MQSLPIQFTFVHKLFFFALLLFFTLTCKKTALQGEFAEGAYSLVLALNSFFELSFVNISLKLDCVQEALPDVREMVFWL
ncbi:MAG: hypothetical protein A2Y28_02200 [Chlamydiae bacterium GWC2_50_10]|nr:MAG: hypothetical protein A2Z85_00855 [Chlamydiae bacterium GWA2_50_15]OGN53903.1 MAG: hypothetical protein A2098_04285 [Chlamydiae bacterium GWF2_49_8]OGN53941.1 MAG: hypothetical protein A2Y28_02200 [Chlamydiae bacterium GWC2_50_10]OGN58020.1 MAG: hypothetical protein A3D18_00580 [Chlamydiae bacterium RIFCSPHIGHO2_02_FULL_49_29]OGN63680.1 MAG: hypothetical protein A3E26_01480 [Chlamydiae bacterium RIFCSPHIGHO2_12_FULL_49_32]OGN71826.1 MAG: hypothetical protein A3I15_01400 [Chlamydiae bact